MAKQVRVGDYVKLDSGFEGYVTDITWRTTTIKSLAKQGFSQGDLASAGLIIARDNGSGFYDRFRARVMFTITDLRKRVVGFGGRVLGEGTPKYLNSPETPLYSKSNVLYCLDKAKEPARKQKYFIIVEGYLDAIACHQYGAQNAVATLGTALTEGHLRLMRRFAQNLVLIFDPDPAGVKAAMRGLDLFVSSGMKVNVVSLPDNDDPDTFLKKNGYEAFASCLRKSEKFMDFVLGQVVKGGQTASIDEKVEKAREMLGFIARLQSGIERDHYLKRTAEALDLDEGILRQEMPRQVKGMAHLPTEGKAPEGHRGHRPRAEETLIHLMLKDAEIALSLKDQMKPEDFTDPLFQRAAKLIFSALDDHGRFDVGALVRDGDAELKNLISHYSVLEMVYDDQAKSCRDCVDLIKQKDPEKKMKFLLKAIDEAAAKEDWVEYRRLLEEQNQLGRRAGRRIPGLGG